MSYEPHGGKADDHPGFSGRSIIRMSMGVILTGTGIVLGLWLISVIIGIVRGDVPGMTRHVQELGVTFVEQQQLNVQLSPGAVQGVALLLTFLLLILPTMIAGSILRGGISLLRGDSRELLEELLMRLRHR